MKINKIQKFIISAVFFVFIVLLITIFCPNVSSGVQAAIIIISSILEELIFRELNKRKIIELIK